MRGPFAIRNFRLAFGGVLLLFSSQWIQYAALGWIVYDITGSGTLLGIANAARGLMNFAFSPFAGLACDRAGGARVATLSAGALALLCLIIVPLIASGALLPWHLIAFSAATGIAMAFSMPAVRILLFESVPRELMPKAAALGSLGTSLARTMGPVIGGALIVAVGSATNFLFQAAVFAGAMVLAFLLGRRLPRPAGRSRPPILRSMIEGYQFAWRDRRFRLLIMLNLIGPLLIQPIHLAIMPIYAKDIFAEGPASLGLMLSAIGAGGLIGSGLTMLTARLDRGAVTSTAALIVFSICQIAFGIVGAVTANLPLSCLFLVLGGVAEAVYFATSQTMMQLVAPDALRGRLTSLQQISQACLPIGLTAAGILADLVGASFVAIGFAAIALVIAATVLAGSSTLRGLRTSELIKHG